MNARVIEDTESPEPARGHVHARSVVNASVWATFGFVAGQGLRLLGNIALAALLFQEAFALMAIASAVMQGLTMFSDLGLGPSVVQSRRGDDRSFLDTAWTLQVLRGALLTLIACVVAWPLAHFYAQNDPLALELRWLLPLVTLSTFVAGFNSSKLLTATRHMNVARLTLIDIGAQVTSLAVMITLAWFTRSVYALAIGSIVGALFQCTLSHLAMSGARNRFRWDTSAVREIFGFGKWLFLSTLITFFAMQLDKLVFARLFPLSEVGVYTIAATLAVLTPMLMGRLQTMIAFPLYSRALDHTSDLQPILNRSKLPMLTVGGYLVALSIAGAQTFIDFAYDERYARAGLYIPILAAGAWFAVIDGIYGAAFLATGRARWVALVNGTKVLSFCALLIPATQVAGLLGAVIAVAASDVIKLGVALNRARTIDLKDYRLEVLFTAVTAAVGLFVFWLTMHSGLFDGWHEIPVLIVQLVLVTVAFSPYLLKVARDARESRQQLPEPVA